jgi:FAD/FMN-containing dehydrogenase
MAKKKKFDGIITAVHYRADQQVDWVRVFLRRGPTFSDRTMLSRQELIDRLQAGDLFGVGNRLEFLASTFDVSQPVHLIERNNQAVLVAGEVQSDVDCLEGVPII